MKMTSDSGRLHQIARVASSTTVALCLLMTGSASASSIAFQFNGQSASNANAMADNPLAVHQTHKLEARRVLGSQRVAELFLTESNMDCAAPTALELEPAASHQIGAGGGSSGGSSNSASRPGLESVGRMSTPGPALFNNSFRSGGSISGGGGNVHVSSGDETAEFRYAVAENNGNSDNAASNVVYPHVNLSSHMREDYGEHGNRSRSDRSNHVLVPFPAPVWMGLIGLAIIAVVGNRRFVTG